MPKPYSQDLRDRVIDAVRKGAISRRAAARRYEISESAIKWLERVERDGRGRPLDTAAIAPPSSCRIGSSLRRCGPRNRTSRFRRFAIAFCPSEASRPTPR